MPVLADHQTNSVHSFPRSTPDCPFHDSTLLSLSQWWEGGLCGLPTVAEGWGGFEIWVAGSVYRKLLERRLGESIAEGTETVGGYFETLKTNSEGLNKRVGGLEDLFQLLTNRL